MLIFAKDIRKKGHKHSREEIDPGLKEYMDYQRSLFPFTIVRSALDLAYKDIDDLLSYVDNNYRPPDDSQRKEFPEDIPGWYQDHYPWASHFMDMENAHSMLVVLITAMENTRVLGIMNAYHWMVVYDVVRNMVKFHNDLLSFSREQADTLRLSKGVAIDFDDFVNNYWSRLDFMIMSKPDYPHARLMERNREIEKEIQKLMAEGDTPETALGKIAQLFGLDEYALACLRHDPMNAKLMELSPAEEDPYVHLYQALPGNPPIGEISVIDAEYAMNYKFFLDQKNH